MDDGIEIPYLAPIVQHPSTPSVLQNPHDSIESCLQDIFVPAISIMTEYGFDIHDDKFQQYLHIVVNCLRAILLDQRGIHHPLIDSFEDTK